MKDFDRNFKRMGFVFWAIFIFNILFSVSIVCGIGWLAYVLLKHFGIVG
ncbi:hypothetical protein [Viridibacillus arvi]